MIKKFQKRKKERKKVALLFESQSKPHMDKSLIIESGLYKQIIDSIIVTCLFIEMGACYPNPLHSCITTNCLSLSPDLFRMVGHNKATTSAPPPSSRCSLYIDDNYIEILEWIVLITYTKYNYLDVHS